MVLAGDFLNNLVLSENSPAELRIQRIREYLLGVKRPRVSTHRARLFTRAYRLSQDEPSQIRKAKAFYHVMENIPIPIIPEQLLAGSPVSFYGAIEIDPEYYTGWLLSASSRRGVTQLRNLAFRDVSSVDISQEDLILLEEEILPYWKDIHLGAYVCNDLNVKYPKAASFINEAGVFLSNFGKGFSHTIQDYKSVVIKGLSGIKEEIKAEKDALSGAQDTEENISKLNNYDAMLICADAVIVYARRCADACVKAADLAGSDSRREELNKMAQVCRKVPESAAQSWWETMQSIHFMHMATFLADGGVSHSLGRMDYYLYPLYKNWLDGGSETKEKAQELLECFFLKCYEYQSLREETIARSLAGDRTNDKITIGGIDANGHDITNDLTFRFLEAHAHVHLKEPNISLRINRDTPDRLLFGALEVVRLGSGLPQFINDDVIVPALIMKADVDLVDARNYADIGCQENSVDPNSSPNQSDSNGHNNAGFFNFAKVLELTLYNGVNPINTKQVGPKTGDQSAFKSMQDFINAFKIQLGYAIEMNVIMNRVVEHHFSETIANPYLSLMHPGPRKSGIDYVAGGCRYNWIGAVGVGLATVADSLMVIEDIVYESRVCVWEELFSALMANWEGHDKLRNYSLSLLRYGGGGRRAEFWARWLVDIFSAEYEIYIYSRGDSKSKFVIGLFSMGIHLMMGNDVLATPDGRYAHEMLSGSIAPSQYAKPTGYTATHNAAASIDSLSVPNGIVFNQIMPSNLVSRPVDLKRWAALLKTFFEIGGMSVQYSVVNGNEMKAAQNNPQMHKDLIVRIGGYSARFIDLSKEIQDDFISRSC